MAETRPFLFLLLGLGTRLHVYQLHELQGVCPPNTFSEIIHDTITGVFPTQWTLGMSVVMIHFSDW